MKITYESYGKTTTIETKEDIDIYELKDILHSLCIAQGWSKTLLEEIFKNDR